MNGRGFTLIEVIAALALIAGGALSVAQLTVLTTREMRVVRVQISTVTLAMSRMEELRSLEWTFDAAGNTVDDRSTDLAGATPASGGAGLTPSPAGTLDENTSGYVDFLDARGRWLSAGPAVPPEAAFVRRWSIEVPADGSADSLVLQVLVRPVAEDSPRSGGRPAMVRGEARLLSLRTRVAR